MQKTLGHSYRAFFDVADWVSINLRDKIENDLKKYRPETLKAVYPQYYNEIKPGILRLNNEIAKIRTNKDVPKNRSSAQLIPEVEEYRNRIQRLLEYYEDLPSYIPQLEEWQFKEQEKEKSDLTRGRISFWGGALLVILGVILTILLQSIISNI